MGLQWAKMTIFNLYTGKYLANRKNAATHLSIKIGMSDRPTALHTALRPQQRYHWAWRAIAS